MTANSKTRVWINPWKYYHVTAGMDESQREAIMQRVQEQAEAGNTDALREFSFVSLENPYLTWRRERQRKTPASRFTSL